MKNFKMKKAHFSLLATMLLGLPQNIQLVTLSISIFLSKSFVSPFSIPKTKTKCTKLAIEQPHLQAKRKVRGAQQIPTIYQPSPRTLSLSSNESTSNEELKTYQHTLGILTFPLTSFDKIANEAILETCMKYTSNKISIVLRCPSSKSGSVKLNELRGYVGEIYSLAWDCVLGLDKKDDAFLHSSSLLLDVIIYPQYLPNTAPEEWINHRPDLECICTHDSITGWYSSCPKGKTGESYRNIEGHGVGGLDEHVKAVNQDRESRGLTSLDSLNVENWPEVCTDLFQTGQTTARKEVIFLEDEEYLATGTNDLSNDQSANTNDLTNEINNGGLIGGGSYRIPSEYLYNSVAVGGTFDGMHYGHRKLLTLAVSSVMPNGGKLLIGITTNEMLKHKAYANLIPSLEERIRGVREFIDALAPGMKNRIKVIPITDVYGPPGATSDSTIYKGISNDFDALVLSNESLLTGQQLNEHRVTQLGIKPLKLLCTRRTEAHGMSSTALRKMRKLNDDLHQDLTQS